MSINPIRLHSINDHCPTHIILDFILQFTIQYTVRGTLLTQASADWPHCPNWPHCLNQPHCPCKLATLFAPKNNPHIGTDLSIPTISVDQPHCLNCPHCLNQPFCLLSKNDPHIAIDLSMSTISVDRPRCPNRPFCLVPKSPIYWNEPVYPTHLSSWSSFLPPRWPHWRDCTVLKYSVFSLNGRSVYVML